MAPRRIVCIVGPTACHKTDCSIDLAERVGGEIVSADSVQVYTGMDIGSAKPTVAERRGIPHHMLDCVPIDTPDFSAARYRELAVEAIRGILARGRVPIVVGGSGLYVSSLTYPLGFAVPKNEDARQKMDALYAQNPQTAFERLKTCDPASAARLHMNDRKRVIRALEVYECSGKPLSAYGNDFQNTGGQSAPFEPLMIGLNMERSALYGRIEHRVDAMFARGLVEEARHIYESEYDRTLPAMQSIGYKQLFSHFDGAYTLEEAAERIKLDTRHFAKRQLTWFLRDERTLWQDLTAFDEAYKSFLTRAEGNIRRWMDGEEGAANE